MAVHQLASIISSCPKLQHLALSQLHFTDTALQQPRSILLGELRALRITDLQTDDDEIYAGLYESVLDLISPGQNALSVEISLTYVSESIQQALDAVRSFVERSNVSKLYVHGKPVSGLWRGDPYFALQLGPLPRVQTLILEAFCFCDVVRIKSCLLAIDDNDGINTLHNPRPVDSELVLWPDVRNLYLRQCIIDGEYLHHLVLLRSVQTLYLRDCATNLEAGLDPDSDSGASVGTQRSTEECAQLFSQAGLKVVTSPTWDISWPTFLL
ncbi:hypothetical protein FRC09_017546 [Ceratobasidium sp. 395]|nr:hypothetical protein FRC09_017546 [Ceratobasidium sp. 395]